MDSAPKLPLLESSARALPSMREVEFAEMPVRQILNRCTSPAMPFRWTINPYRGCEFGCVYCYARYTHEFLELRDPMDFERRIFVKRGAAEVLARTLARTPLGSDQIALGTATDPYQPAERKYELTRAMLRVFAQMGGLNLSITTKSALIARDLDLLRRINQHSRLSVNFSLITMNRRLQRVLEPRAPRPALRLRALAQLSAAGIRCHVLMMPMLPGITDDAAAVESVMAAARRAGASGVW
ncbi:MAG: radical SAM protein [Candidatus Binataceae bacterium]